MTSESTELVVRLTRQGITKRCRVKMDSNASECENEHSGNVATKPRVAYLNATKNRTGPKSSCMLASNCQGDDFSELSV